MTNAVTSTVMKNTHPYAHPAGSAIFAALALIAPPTLAQDVTAPVVVAESPPAATAAPTITAPAAPTIVIPDPIVIPQSEPVAATTAAPAATGPTAVAPRERAAQAAPATRRAAPVRSDRMADVRPVAAAPGVENVTPAEDTAVAPAALPMPAAAPAPEIAPVAGEPKAASDNSLLLAGGGVLAGLALIGLILAASARRRRRAVGGKALVRPAYEPERERLAAAASARADMPPPAPPTAAPAGFVVSYAVSRDRNVSKWEDPIYVNAAPVAVAGRSVPNTPEGRKALIDRLVRANPDRTNPFHSLAARRRRARLIVQSMAQRMHEQPNLDFRRFYDSFGRHNQALA